MQETSPIQSVAHRTSAAYAERIHAQGHDAVPRRSVLLVLGVACTFLHCSGETDSSQQNGSAGSGSAAAAGGVGSSSGGQGAGGAPAGGQTNTGATTSTGGTDTGTGGDGAGGSGATPGTGATTGSGGTGETFSASYFLGADITFEEPRPPATRAALLETLKERGFNFIRLRTFVDPRAADGYDKANGSADIESTVAFGKQIKDAGMGLLVDFHYSNNWADPAKQCVPIAWQSYTTIAELAGAVRSYTTSSIEALVAGGARPDMVQIGNEITPGMLIHRCDAGGLPTSENPITGKSDNENWGNLGTLLKAGVQGVRDVDADILISMHIDRCDDFQTSKWWLDSARAQGVPFTHVGQSCYQRYQGVPNDAVATKNGWTNTLTQLVATYPDLFFFAAEYGPMQREINDVVFDLPNQRGVGTFNWEPAREGDWNTGHTLLTRSGDTYTPTPDLALYDRMKIDYASRL